jgi:hypothetical protein
MFFFAKKNQKTFVASGTLPVRSATAAQKFFASFFQKRRPSLKPKLHLLIIRPLQITEPRQGQQRKKLPVAMVAQIEHLGKSHRGIGQLVPFPVGLLRRP